MPARIDLTGKTINEITVLGFSHSHVQPSGQKRAMWHTRCSCGIEKMMSTSTLTTAISCGHVGAENRRKAKCKAPGEAAFNYLFIAYFHTAKNRGIEFSIDRETFRNLTQGNCHYCGVKPSQIRHGRNNGNYVYNGIDRKDNNIGYVVQNVVSCCSTCNFMKSSKSESEFIEHIKRIYSHAQKGL